MQAGPELSRALDALLEDHRHFEAARELFRALRRVPAEERGTLLRAAAGPLPQALRQGFARLVQRKV